MSGLRLMIYDSTDMQSWKKPLREHLPPSAEDVMDRLDFDLGLSQSWWAGGQVYKHFGRFDHVKGCESWEEALEWLCEIGEDEKIAEIQSWTHGSPGKVWMNSESLNRKSFGYNKFAPLLAKLRKRLTPESLVWFRTCGLFCGQRGYNFARTWAEKLGCRIAGHTFVIGIFQAGLHTIGPGETPQWYLKEGINEGTADNPLSLRLSMWWSPNMIFCLRSEIPESW